MRQNRVPAGAAVRVARALLGLLPAADAGEAITGAWLRSVGFSAHPIQDGALRKAITPVGAGHAPSWLMFSPSHSHQWRIDAGGVWVMIHPQRTRGDVYALCAALGLPLAPAAGGGA